MPSKIDDISFQLGGLKEATTRLAGTTEDLTASFRIHCKDDDNRHAENIGALRNIETSIAQIAAQRLVLPAPGVTFSRRTMALAAAFSAGILSLLVTGIQFAAGRAIDWFIARIH